MRFLRLPALLFVSLSNIHSQTDAWQQGGKITLFLHDYVTQSEAEQLMQSLQDRQQISSVRYISKKQAWDLLQEQFSEQDMSQLITENPLPAAIEIIPSKSDATALANLRLVLQNLDGVADILLDIAWVQRLQQWLQLLTTSVWIVSVLLGSAVLLIVGNTIRLNIAAQQEQIIVAKLVGATNSFIRRGFLYLGFWYGLFGAVGAWIIVFICALLLQQPLSQLAANYQMTDFVQIKWSAKGTVWLFLGSITCAMIGAWMAVWRHLRDIRPT